MPRFGGSIGADQGNKHAYLLLEGFEDIDDILETMLPREARNLNRATIHAIASNIAKNARKYAPVGKTGMLKKSIRAVRRRPKHPDRPYSDVIVKSRDPKKSVFYWSFVENGTQKIPKQPFIAPAVRDAKQTLQRDYREFFFKKLEARLKRQARKNAGLIK